MIQHSALESPDQHDKANVTQFMQRFTIETTPRGAKSVSDFRDHVAEGTLVYVTSLPGSDFRDIVGTCRRLSKEGMVPVPHITARAVADTSVLDERLDQVTSEAGVKRILAIAGSDRTARGEFPDTISMLETGLFDKYDIQSIGVAGHPEDIPGLERMRILEHEARKLSFARATGIDIYIVTQFVFEATPVIEFVERVRSIGNELPIIVGLPGLATVKSLIRHAKACGIGPSMQFMTRGARGLRKLLSVQEPDQLVLRIANYRAANPDCGIDGVHIFPFGGFEKSASWANAVAAGQFSMNPDGFSPLDHLTIKELG